MILLTETASRFETSILDAAFDNNNSLIISLICEVQNVYDKGYLTDKEYNFLNNINEIKHLIYE